MRVLHVYLQTKVGSQLSPVDFDEGCGHSWIVAHVQMSHLTRDEAAFTSAHTNCDKLLSLECLFSTQHLETK